MRFFSTSAIKPASIMASRRGLNLQEAFTKWVLSIFSTASTIEVLRDSTVLRAHLLDSLSKMPRHNRPADCNLELGWKGAKSLLPKNMSTLSESQFSTRCEVCNWSTILGKSLSPHDFQRVRQHLSDFQHAARARKVLVKSLANDELNDVHSG